MPAGRFPPPSHAYVPGRTRRHKAGAFAALCASVQKGSDADDLAQSDAWAAGWQFLDDGFYWEAHEVWEPVWMALPEGTDARRLVQAAIQTANAALKQSMGRPVAVLRLCGIVDDLLRDLGAQPIMGVDPAVLVRRVHALRRAANLAVSEISNMQDNAQ